MVFPVELDCTKGSSTILQFCERSCQTGSLAAEKRPVRAKLTVTTAGQPVRAGSHALLEVEDM